VFQDDTKPNSGNKFYGSSHVVLDLKAAGFDLIPLQARESLLSAVTESFEFELYDRACYLGIT
jgi:hypothetical protein